MVGYIGQGHQGRALFICPQPEGTVAGGQSFLFATLKLWIVHWNSFHVAAAPLFKCMVRGCDFETAATPDSLDLLFRQFIDTYPSVHVDGEWPNLVNLVVMGLHVKPNTHY